jgi:hypothetical protein
MAIALAASTLKLYPLTARLRAFSAPLWAMLAALGVRAVATRVPAHMAARVTSLVTGGLLATAGVDAALSLTNPYWRRAHMSPLIRVLEEEQRATGDPIYVMPRAAPQWLFYTTPWRSDPAPVRRDSASQWLEQRTCVRRGSERTLERARCSAPTGTRGTPTWAGSRARQTAWADHEILRPRAAAVPCGWVLMQLPYPGEPAALARAVQTHGGRVESALEDRMHPNRDAATNAFRVCFGGPANAP